MIQWHDIPKIQRLADWQHPIFFGPAPMDGLDVQMDGPAFSQSDPSKFLPAIPTWVSSRRGTRCETPKPPRSPTASCSLVQFQWEFIFANLPGGTPRNISQSTQCVSLWERGWKCSWLTVLNSSLCFCGALGGNIWASNSGLICPQSSCAK